MEENKIMVNEVTKKGGAGKIVIGALVAAVGVVTAAILKRRNKKKAEIVESENESEQE